MMTYIISRRHDDAPADLLKVRHSGSYGLGRKKLYEIIDVLVHNDSHMYYKKAIFEDIYLWNVLNDRGELLNHVHFDEMEMNTFDKLYEFENDEAAKLYFEVMSNEL